MDALTIFFLMLKSLKQCEQKLEFINVKIIFLNLNVIPIELFKQPIITGFLFFPSQYLHYDSFVVTTMITLEIIICLRIID